MHDNSPPKEPVVLDFGFSMNVAPDDPDAVRVIVADAGSPRRVIGMLRFSRRTLAEMLASRSDQPATWQQYRPKQ